MKLILALVIMFMISAAHAEPAFENVPIPNPYIQASIEKPYLTTATYKGSNLQIVIKSVTESIQRYKNHANTKETRQKILEEYTEFFLLISSEYDIMDAVIVVCDETNNVSSGTESSIIIMDIYFYASEFKIQDKPEQIQFTVNTYGKEA